MIIRSEIQSETILHNCYSLMVYIIDFQPMYSCPHESIGLIMNIQKQKEPSNTPIFRALKALIRTRKQPAATLYQLSVFVAPQFLLRSCDVSITIKGVAIIPPVLHPREAQS